jgi:hypothetical protein
MAVVFLDIGKTFYITYYLDLLCKLSKLKLLIGLIELTGFFLSERKLRISVEREFPTSKNIRKKGCHKVSFCSLHSIYYIYIYIYIYTKCRNSWCLRRSPCWWHLHICERPQRGYVLRNLQRGLSAIDTLCENQSIKSTKASHRPSTFLLDLGPLRLILHWIDGKSPSSIMYNIWV